jgi:hypothetical protein
MGLDLDQLADGMKDELAGMVSKTDSSVGTNRTRRGRDSGQRGSLCLKATVVHHTFVDAEGRRANLIH